MDLDSTTLALIGVNFGGFVLAIFCAIAGWLCSYNYKLEELNDLARLDSKTQEKYVRNSRLANRGIALGITCSLALFIGLMTTPPNILSAGGAIGWTIACILTFATTGWVRIERFSSWRRC
jgi:hypothetical protein